MTEHNLQPVLGMLKTLIQEYNEAWKASPVTRQLIILIVGVFICEILLSIFLSLRSVQVFATGLFGVYPWLAWSLSPLLHRGVPHFLSNFFFLVLVGVPIEKHWSSWKRYSIFLVATGYITILSGALILQSSTDQSVAFYGISGVVYAIAGFSLTHLPRCRIDTEIEMGHSIGNEEIVTRIRSLDLNWVEKFAVIVGVITLLSVILDLLTGLYIEHQGINGGHLSGFVIGATVGWFGWNRCIA